MMKIGRLSLEFNGNQIVVENIEIENLADLKNIVELLGEESKFVKPVCSYQKVCTDYPKKCPQCTYSPKKTYFSQKHPFERMRELEQTEKTKNAVKTT